MLKIGVFDSGLGGLTVVKSMIGLIKGAELFYIADTLHAPYGEKSREEILRLSRRITRYFIDTHQIDALIVACNTATSAAINHLREEYPDLIIIGTEPGLKPAFAHTKTKRVGVLATPATLSGDKYQELANTLGRQNDIVLYEQACPGLVAQIEKGEIDTPKTEKMLESWLAPMRENGVDTIVLGCTHYPLVGKTIQKVMGQEIFLVETGEAIARRLLRLSEKKGHRNEGMLKIQVYATGGINTQLVHTILASNKSIETIKIP